MSKENLALFVASTDSYQDCWAPFFSLLARHWPQRSCPVYLGSETREFSDPSNTVVTLRSGFRNPKTPWSDNIIAQLRQIPEPYILWTLDDLFLAGPVDELFILRKVEQMQSASLPYVQLQPFGASRYYKQTEFDGIWEIAERYRYRLSLMSGLWQREALLSLLVPGENPWQTEIRGSVRSSARGLRLCSIQPVPLNAASSLPYPTIVTGITKRKWNPAVEPLFRSAGLDVDLSLRGFHRELPTFLRKAQTLYYLLTR